MSNEKILIVEDEEDLIELLRYNLQRESYKVETATSGSSAINKAKEIIPDLILLDLMLPDIDGFEVCRTLKNSPKTCYIPIIMVTAKTEESDIVSGLEVGAFDYITKPFSPKVLIARIRAVLRRATQVTDNDSSTIKIHNITIYPQRHEITVNEKPVTLTFTEFNLLLFFVKNAGRVYTRYQLIDNLHGTNYPVTDRSVDVQITGLRKKLGSAGKYIETVRGIGYKLRE
jgi:two-component system alkaline phosphatase synthesis response regulator PhoP